jgi:hypothetical protein
MQSFLFYQNKNRTFMMVIDAAFALGNSIASLTIFYLFWKGTLIFYQNSLVRKNNCVSLHCWGKT